MAKSIKSKFAAKLGSKLHEAHEAHKGDETNYGQGGDMPAGVDHGVAQLVECKVSQYKTGENKGEYFFYAAGVCIEPKSVYDAKGKRNISVEGLRTQFGPVPLCDTPNARGKRKTFEDHYAYFLNCLRMLGVDTTEVDPDDLETTLEALKEAAPYFKFRTWTTNPTTEFPNPRVNHDWNGIIEDYEAPEGDDEVEEEEAPAKPVKNKKAAKAQEEETEEEEVEEEAEEEEEETEEEIDYLALGRAADKKKDKAAIKALTQAALDAGWEKDQIEESESWTAVAEALANPEEGESESEEEEEEWKPAKDETCLYRPIDPKTKKPSKKAIEVVIVKSLSKAETADVRCLATKKLYSAVDWSDLEQQ